MKTNILLENLYKSKWDMISNKLGIWQEDTIKEDGPDDNSNKATHPFLIKTDKNYESADFKIMIFGKEPNVWGNEFNEGIFEEGVDIDSVISIYDKVYLQNLYEKDSRPFWNFVKGLKNIQFEKKVGYICNNVLKIGKSKSGPPQQGLINYTLDFFNVIPQEIEILKPKVLLFLSGHTYDEHIKKSVGNFAVVPIEGFTTNELCILKFDDINVDLAIRTYHPGYLQRKQELKKTITETIMNLIMNQN
jgi:hypothetical protein